MRVAPNMVKNFPAAVCAILLLLAPGLAAAQVLCPPVAGRSYDVAVKIDVPAPKLDRTKTRAALGSFAPHGTRLTVLGAMRSDLEFESRATYGHVATADGVCIWVEQVKVDLRYRSLDMFVAKEYAPSSCAYRAILAHEKQHADIARRYVERYAPRIRQALASLLIPKSSKPLVAASTKAAEAKVDAVLDRLVAPVVAELEREMDKAQRELDSPRSYEAVFRQCTDW